jgi:aryl-alcohol dehydrogenase-like predicted oxidoreductase
MTDIEHFELAPDYAIPRIINGGYQLMGMGADDALQLPLQQADAGLVAFETADIYPGGEDLLGAVQATRRRDNAAPIRIHTRYSPDLTSGPPSSKEVVNALDAALLRLRSDHIDLLQLQWWQLDTEGWLDVYGWLAEQQLTGKIAHLGLSNFTHAALQTILQAGLPVASNQVQISLVDQRALGDMRETCLANDIALLGYGPLCGGFLSSPKPDPRTQNPMPEHGREYRLMVDLFGGWDLLQELVATLETIAARHDTSASVIALRWLLDQKGVSALLLGASSPRNIASNLSVFQTGLTAQDHHDISSILDRMTPPDGGPGELERQPDGIFRKTIEESAEAWKKPEDED